MNNPENQAIDVSNIRSTDDSPSNANCLINNQNNQDMFKDWCEEDGDFEVDEVVQQGDHHETQLPPSPPPPQQPIQHDSVNNNGGFDFDDEMINSGQISSLNNNNQSTNNVMRGEKQNEEEDIEALQSSTTNNKEDDTIHFDEDLEDLMTEEIGKTNIGNLCTAQNNEVPVQSVLIDQKDVVTLEDEVIKSQSPEKVQKSKQSPQKGKKKGGRKSKAESEILSSAAESTPNNKIKYDQDDDQNDQNDQLDSENDPKTKSGRKVQRPSYFNPANFGRGRRKSSFEPGDLANESSRKTKRQTGKRKSKNKIRDTNVTQEVENVLSDPSAIYVDAEEDNIVCTVCRDGTSIKQNWIVFCDKCDAPYHQRCHKPRIEDIVVEQTDWICSKCKNLTRSNKRIKVDIKSPEQEIHEDKEQGQELISIGTVLTREQKVEYLSSLSQDVLVNLLLLAEQMEPNIPLYPANILGRYVTANMSFRDNEMDEVNQDTEECLNVDLQTSGLPTTETSNLSTLDMSPNLNPVNIENVPPQIPEQDIQQEPITPESSPPLNSLREVTEYNKDSYLNLYIRAMSEIGNPNGSTAQTMHSWIKSNYNVPENFTAKAKKALSFAVSKGIFVKNSRMTYKFNPDYTFSYNNVPNTNEQPIVEDEIKNVEVNVNNNDYDGPKSTYKESSSGLQGEGIPGIGNSDIKDFNFYPNQDYYFDSIMDPNFLGKGEETYTATTQSQRSSLSNPVGENPIADHQYSSSSDKLPPPPTSQSQPISSVPKLPVNAQIMINEQTRSDIRLPPLAPKPSINVLPSIMRSNSIGYQTNELLTSSIGGGGNDFSFQPPQILPKNHILPLPRVNNNDNNITRNIITTATKIRTPSIMSSNYSILTPAVIRSGNQSQQPQQMYDNTKARTPSSSIPSLQSLPAIDNSLNGNVGKIRTQQMISSTMHNTSTTIPTSPQQTWPSSFNPFYMSPQPGDAQYTTIFDNTFYDPAAQQSQHHHQHSSTASTNDYNNVDLQHNDNNSLFNRMSGNQQDNNILGDWEYRNV